MLFYSCSNVLFVSVRVCLVALPSVASLQLFDATHSTMQARWSRVDGVSGYMLLYAPITDDGDLNNEVGQEAKS